MMQAPNNHPASIEASPEEQIRSLLFDKAAAANRRLLDRIDAVAEDLGRNNALGVIGAIEGADEDIKALRAFMLLVRDHFPHTTG
jgi:hypothetical protein